MSQSQPIAMSLNQSQVLLSIVITSYTTERFKDIYELLDSIKVRTYPNIEVIFVALGYYSHLLPRPFRRYNKAQGGKRCSEMKV